jgi:hypothetical protein
MSFSAAAGILSGLSTVLFQTHRAIGTIIPGCAIEERHVDRMTITQHPVEFGAPVNDHMYVMPAEVTLRWAWSNSILISPATLLSGAADLTQLDPANLIGGLFGDGYVQQVYKKLLAMRISGKLFSVFTGKRMYTNMAMPSLMVVTDVNTENSLMVVAVCQEVIIVSTQSTQVPSQDQQTFPQQTSPNQSQGPQQPTPQGPSILVHLNETLGLGLPVQGG